MVARERIERRKVALSEQGEAAGTADAMLRYKKNCGNGKEKYCIDKTCPYQYCIIRTRNFEEGINMKDDKQEMRELVRLLAGGLNKFGEFLIESAEELRELLKAEDEAKAEDESEEENEGEAEAEDEDKPAQVDAVAKSPMYNLPLWMKAHIPDAVAQSAEHDTITEAATDAENKKQKEGT